MYRLIHGYLQGRAKTGALLLAFCAMLMMQACARDQSAMQVRAGGDSLYADLGGEAGITDIVDQFLYRLASNEKVVHFFQNSNIDRFRTQIISHLSHISGGPFEYTGDTMRDAHAGMVINQSHFNSVAETLLLSMEDLGYPSSIGNRLVARLAGLEGEVRNLE
jgi:hemoglobin